MAATIFELPNRERRTSVRSSRSPPTYRLQPVVVQLCNWTRNCRIDAEFCDQLIPCICPSRSCAQFSSVETQRSWQALDEGNRLLRRQTLEQQNIGNDLDLVMWIQTHGDRMPLAGTGELWDLGDGKSHIHSQRFLPEFFQRLGFDPSVAANGSIPILFDSKESATVWKLQFPETVPFEFIPHQIRTDGTHLQEVIKGGEVHHASLHRQIQSPFEPCQISVGHNEELASDRRSCAELRAKASAGTCCWKGQNA